MIEILMISIKLATLGSLKKRDFEIKVLTLLVVSMTSPTISYDVIEIIL